MDPIPHSYYLTWIQHSDLLLSLCLDLHFHIQRSITLIIWHWLEMLLIRVRQRVWSQAKSLISRKHFPIGVVGRMNWENTEKRSIYSTENMQLETSRSDGARERCVAGTFMATLIGELGTSRDRHTPNQRALSLWTDARALDISLSLAMARSRYLGSITNSDLLDALYWKCIDLQEGFCVCQSSCTRKT